MKRMSFAAAIRDYFNIPQDQMMREFKALTPADKAELRVGLEANGYEIVEQPGVAPVIHIIDPPSVLRTFPAVV